MAQSQRYRSWGRAIHSMQQPLWLHSRHDSLPTDWADGSTTALPYGNGRSYGDSCLNPNGYALPTRQLNHFIDFNPQTGLLSCEAGVLLDAILQLTLPQGWFLSVTPGTRFVTVGGAIANDVHGKNHHKVGSFGHHVTELELLRSDNSRSLCTPTHQAALFRATLGGLGLTGLITRATLQLRPVHNPWLAAETVRFSDLGHFFELAAESDRDYEYTVAWIDCASQGKRLGRGLFMRGNHAPAQSAAPPCYRSRSATFPLTPPLSLVNQLSLTLFNQLYYHKQWSERVAMVQHYEPFFYPLDGILEWNRLYGPKGFYQYQCVIPMQGSYEAVRELLQTISASGMGSFLAVLKVCGEIAPAGLLSFPLAGATLALDFPNRGAALERLFERLDTIVSHYGGRLYPAKDGRMPAALFQQGYPEWQLFSQWLDPHFSSAFWRRVTER
ncbi:FAD-binding oxidoreductase [Ectothiorhodospiraceae bacterium BW-2]|nr:FAD-binding oxidoreductase [Ectothiorhodospiraceae bacterium BW-2]